MIDGVVLSRDVVVIVAIGFCSDGRKMVLDFVRGHTENYELCRELLGRLVKRASIAPRSICWRCWTEPTR